MLALPPLLPPLLRLLLLVLRLLLGCVCILFTKYEATEALQHDGEQQLHA